MKCLKERESVSKVRGGGFERKGGRLKIRGGFERERGHSKSKGCLKEREGA